jgi:hypothetical protein
MSRRLACSRLAERELPGGSPRCGGFFPDVTKAFTLAFWHGCSVCNLAVTACYIVCLWRRLTRHGLGKGERLEKIKFRLAN